MISYPVVFASSPSLIGSLLKDQRHDTAADFLVVKYQGYIGGKSQPANFDKTDYQTIQIIYFTLFSFFYFMARQKDCPDPIVARGARLCWTGIRNQQTNLKARSQFKLT